MIVSKAKSSIGLGFSLVVLELSNLVFLYLKPVSYVTPHKLNIGVITMSKLNELKCDFDELKKCIKGFEDGLEAFENNLEEQLTLLRQRPAEFKDDLLGLVHLMDKCIPPNGDVEIVEEEIIITRFFEASFERVTLMYDLFKKSREFDLSTLVNDLLSINSIMKGDRLNLEEEHKG